MNFRQKRKHYNYSYRYFVAWIVVDDEISFAVCPKKFKKTLKRKLKVNKTYEYAECCGKYFHYEEYHGEMPKFMRIIRGAR